MVDKPTPEQLQHFLDCVAYELTHARMYVSTTEKMIPIGLEQYDMVLSAAVAIRDAMRASASAGPVQEGGK